MGVFNNGFLKSKTGSKRQVKRRLAPGGKVNNQVKVAMKIPVIIPALFLFAHPLTLPSPCTPSQAIPDFQVSILYTIQPENYTLNYIVSRDSLQLHYNCAFTHCKDTILYQIRLSAQQAGTYYQLISSLKLDTLQNISETKGFEGVSALIRIRGAALRPQALLTVHLDQPVIAQLIERTNGLIPDPKFRYSAPKQ